MSFPIRRTRRPSSLSLAPAISAAEMLANVEGSGSAMPHRAGSSSSTSHLRPPALHNPFGGQEEEDSALADDPDSPIRGHSPMGLAAAKAQDPHQQGQPKVSTRGFDAPATHAPRTPPEPNQQPPASSGAHTASSPSSAAHNPSELHKVLSSHLHEYQLASSAAHDAPSASSSSSRDTAHHQAPQHKMQAGNDGKRIWGMPDWKDAVTGEEVSPGVKVISINDIVPLLEHYGKLDTPSEVLFPWLHGLGDGPNGPAGGLLEEFFGYPSLDAPRYRGLTILKAPTSEKKAPKKHVQGILASKDYAFSMQPSVQAAALSSSTDPKEQDDDDSMNAENDIVPSRIATPVPRNSLPSSSSAGSTAPLPNGSFEAEYGNPRLRTASVSTYASSSTESTDPSLSSFGHSQDGMYPYDSMGRARRDSPASSMSSVELEGKPKEALADQDPDSIQGMHPTCAKTAASSPERNGSTGKALAATVSRLLGRVCEAGEPEANMKAEEAAPSSPHPQGHIHFSPESDAPHMPHHAKKSPPLLQLRRASAPDASMHSSIGMSRTASSSSGIDTPEVYTSADPSDRISVLRTQSAMGRTRSPSPVPGRSKSPFPRSSPGGSAPASPWLPSFTALTVEQAPELDCAEEEGSDESEIDLCSDDEDEDDLPWEIRQHVPANRCMLANALCMEQVLDLETSSKTQPGRFRRPDMSGEVSLRNLCIQEIKYATISDLIVYAEHGVDEDVLEIAERARQAQDAILHERRELFKWERKNKGQLDNLHQMAEHQPPRYPSEACNDDDVMMQVADSAVWQASHEGYNPVKYNVFVIKESFGAITSRHPELLCEDAAGKAHNNRDLFQREVEESNKLAKATEIVPGLWLGNGHDNPFRNDQFRNPAGYDMVIEAHDTADMPSEGLLAELKAALFPPPGDHLGTLEGATWEEPIFLECCSSSRSVGCAHHTLDMLTSRMIAMCQLLQKVVEAGDAVRKDGTRGKLKVLVFCEDGYTETAVFGLTYLMVSKNLSLEEAYLHLQLQCNRSFFVYPFDMPFLDQIERRLLNMKTQAQPSGRKGAKQPIVGRWRPFGTASDLNHRNQAVAPSRTWLTCPRFDGSLPSRILDHVYLGNLGHAANSRLLKALGITHVVSVGETLSKEFGVVREHYISVENVGSKKTDVITVMEVEDVKDDGNDPLRPKIAKACEFIEEARASGGKTLVHCRVGVSRSATIVLAYLMEYHGMSLIDAYMMTRCRRLNVLIQPHLRFLHELLGWEVVVHGPSRGRPGSPPSGSPGSKGKATVAVRYNWPALCRDLWQLNHRFLVK